MTCTLTIVIAVAASTTLGFLLASILTIGKD